VNSGQYTDSASSLMSSGRNFVSSLFGGNSKWASDLIGREAGLGAGMTATMMALGAHAVINYVGSRVREGGLNATSLAEMLNNEAPAMRRLLPPSFEDAFRTYFPRSESRPIDINPVIAQGVQKEGSSMPWIAAAAVLAGALVWGWYGVRQNRFIEEPLPSRTIGTTGTVAPTDVGRTLPSPYESRYELRYDTALATPQPQSNEQLTSIAETLKAHPNAQVKIDGYTDNVGSPAANMKLSQARADHVRHELIGMGVDGDRITTEGYGEANPVGDNSTDTGRAMNRRISMLVSEK
jgi:OmpA-OmpF porin, OOP family